MYRGSAPTMCVGVPRLVLLGTRNFNLLEPPLRKIDVSGPKVASQNLVLQAEGGRQRTQLAIVARSGVVDDFDLPVVLFVTNS